MILSAVPFPSPPFFLASLGVPNCQELIHEKPFIGRVSVSSSCLRWQVLGSGVASVGFRTLGEAAAVSRADVRPMFITRQSMINRLHQIQAGVVQSSTNLSFISWSFFPL